ncbi:hypothetical protein WJX72_000408 [[Myrmecia] bisecta]|uniref:Uncharacterized protein n=1 Tax=[Myrmecia] bisecta TaxID=41462 RepID=A0AAW1Q5R5_9CHLO
MGRAIGENPEQLHAFLKHFGSTMRYDSTPLRQDNLEDALDFWSEEKYQNYPDLLCQALDSAQRRLAQLCIEKTGVWQQAQAAGISLDPDEAYVRLPTVLQTDDHLTYVKLLLESAFLDGISSNGGTYVAALTGGADHGLLAKAQSADHRRKLEARLQKLEDKLSITLRWREEDDLFMEHAQRLREAEVQNVQLQIEKELSWIQTLRDQRARAGTACHTTRLITARLNARRKKLRELLGMLSGWNAFLQPDDTPIEPFNEEAILSGELPWDPASAVNGVTKEHLHLKLWRISSELARTKEELTYLPIDAMHARTYYNMQLHQLMAVLPQPGDAHLSSEQKGERYLLGCMLRSVCELASRADSLFLKAPWV